MNSQYLRLREALENIRVFDTHEDSIIGSGYWLKGKPYKEWLNKGVDLLEVLKSVWLHIAFDLPKDMSDLTLLSNNLKKIKGHGHLRVAVRAIKDIYGVDISTFDEHILRKASQMISEAYENKKWMEKMLREYGKIDVAVLDKTPTYSLWGGTFNRDYFAGSLKIDMFQYGYNKEAHTASGVSPYTFADMLGIQIESFDDYLSFIDLVFKKARQNGFIAVKSKISYERGLNFENIDEREAKKVFNQLNNKLSKTKIKKFEDFIMHYIIKRASEVGFPIQIHTGMSYQTDYEDANPLKLANLLIQYPETNFALFHGGYPWTNETASLAFCHRNVYADICWLPMISQTASERLVSELIETTGGVRITWGGDTAIGEGACGALAIAKDVIARALAAFVERRFFSYGDAVDIAKKIFFENAHEIYQT